MAIKIKRVRIQNFKLFKDFSIDFSEPNLVVFDGPNGFGKTSFYDALELLFTGRLRRYSELAEMVVDNRQPFTQNPFLYDQGGTGDLVIKAEIQADSQTIYLLRKCDRSELQKTCRIDTFNPKLYTLVDFDSDAPVLVDNEEPFLSDLLGKDYLINFEFLNYIEQEESTYLLKKKDKDRKEAIAHLFNTSEFKTLIDKLTEASNKIRELCGKKVKDELKAEKKKLDDLKGRLTGEQETVPYVRLIKGKKILWDAEELYFSEEQYAQWLGKEGELAQLEFFLTNFDEFKKYRKNKRLEDLLKDEKFVLLLLLCWSFIDKAEEFAQKLSVKKAVEGLLKVYEKGVLEAVVNGEITLSKEVKELIKPGIDSQAYAASIVAIQTLQKNATSLSKLLTGVRDTRNAFVSKFMEYQKETGMKESCPLCGYSWKDAEELKTMFDDQAAQLDQLTRDAGLELAQALDVFQKQFVKPIRNLLQKHLSTHPLDEEFVAKLTKAQQQRSDLQRLYQQFKEADIDLTPFLNIKDSMTEPFNIEKVKEIVKEKMQKVDNERLRSYFDRIFITLFDENFEFVISLERGMLDQKRKYIHWKYSLYQSNVFLEKKTACEKQKEQFDNASALKKKIDALKKIYENSLRDYQREVIEDIEIIFHIYSGRIVQDYQCGLGLFIAEKEGIRFLENPTKTHDAVFSMSSGQLAALIISFTLALNKRYSRIKLLLIDDPVQTLDELNIAGLVELLRNEFGDRQIFISTHEDMMSAYMRYKFEKYGLKTQRLNFKEKLLAAI